MTSGDAGDLVRQRHDKLAALRAHGVDPFGGRYPVTHWAGSLAARFNGAAEEEMKGAGPVSVAGRIVALRHHGKTCFAHLMDYTGRVQLYARADQLGDEYARFTSSSTRAPTSSATSTRASPTSTSATSSASRASCSGRGPAS